MNVWKSAIIILADRDPFMYDHESTSYYHPCIRVHYVLLSLFLTIPFRSFWMGWSPAGATIRREMSELHMWTALSGQRTENEFTELLGVGVLKKITGWWFGTFFIFPYFGNNHPTWLIVFRGFETTSQSLCSLYTVQKARLKFERGTYVFWQCWVWQGCRSTVRLEEKTQQNTFVFYLGFLKWSFGSW